MASNVIAYIGNEHSDILIYLSRILLKLGKKVLIVDHSEYRSIISSVPHPIGLDASSEIITYLQVDYTAMEVKNSITDAYDDVFVSIGYQEPFGDLALCNHIVLITDLHGYNHDRLRQFLDKYYVTERVINTLIIRNNVDTTLSMESILRKINISIHKNEIIAINRNDLDYINSLLCHYNNFYQFTRISRQLQEYLKREIGCLYPQIATTEIDAAYKVARKGG